MPVADERLHRAERHDVGQRRDGREVAVAADAVQRDIGKFLLDAERVAVMVAQMDDQIGAAAAQSLEHRGGVVVGIGKDGGSHGAPPVENRGIIARPGE